MGSATFNIVNDVSTRVNSSGTNQGSNNEKHVPVGRGGDGAIYYGLLRFSDFYVPAGARVTSAILRLKTVENQKHIPRGANWQLYVAPLTSNIAGASGGSEGTWSNTGWPKGSTASGTFSAGAAYATPGNGTPAWGARYDVDVTEAVCDQLPTDRYRPSGAPCLGGAVYGFYLRSTNQGVTNQNIEFTGLSGGYTMQVVINYEEMAAPGNPHSLSPSGSLATGPTSITSSSSNGGTANRWRCYAGTSPGVADLGDSGWVNFTPGGTVTWSPGDIWPKGQTSYYTWQFLNPIGVGSAAVSSNFFVTAETVPEFLTPDPANSPAYVPVTNLADRAEWDAVSPFAKPRVQVRHVQGQGYAASQWQFRINGGTAHTFVGSYLSNVIYSFELDEALIFDTDYTVEQRLLVYGVWGDWTASSTPMRVLWSQGIFSAVHGAGVGKLSVNHGDLAGGGDVTYLYRATGSSTGPWRTSIGQIAPDTGVDVLVRLGANTGADSPALPDMAITWLDSGDVNPDHWTVERGNIRLDEYFRRFGAHSLHVTPDNTGRGVVR